MPRVSGSIANESGALLESFLENVLRQKGYEFVKGTDFEKSVYLEQPIYAKHFYLGKTIYDTKFFGDLIIYHPEKFTDCLVVESKWQQSGGSVDEKFPYLVLNLKQKSPYKSIILLDGGGYKPQAETWLKAQVDGKLLHVFNMREFQTWANKDNI